MKRFFAAVMVLLSVVTLSGCKEVPSFMPGFWNGLTEAGAREYIQSALQEKYGEEFEVLKMYLDGGTWNTSADLLADCSPKSDENIVFAIQVLAFGEERVLRDTYIQSIVRQEMKKNIDSVLSKYYDFFAAEIEVSGLYDRFDSGIRSAKDATVKTYSEALPDTNKTHIWIALNNKEIDTQEKVNNAVNEIVTDFYLTHAYINFYYANDEVINQCLEEIQNESADRWGSYIILQGHYPCSSFVYDGKAKENKITQVEFADKQTKFNGS